MDEGMLDSKAAMVRFLNLIAGRTGHQPAYPSWWTAPSGSVIEAGLKCIQGKSVVNSISH